MKNQVNAIIFIAINTYSTRAIGINRRSIAFASIAVSTFATLDIVLIGTAMAFDAIVELAYALFDVFAPDIDRRVLVAAVAGVGAVIIAHVAGHTGSGVVAIQHEVLVMFKRGGRPLLLGVTLTTVTGNLLMQRVSG
jgi:hypothetical protein